MDAPANAAPGSLVLQKAACECGCSRRSLRAAASRDNRELQIPSRRRIPAVLEYFLPLYVRSESCTPHVPRAPAAASSKSHAQTDEASPAKDRAKREAAAPRQAQSLQAGEVFLAEESATSSSGQGAKSALDGVQTSPPPTVRSRSARAQRFRQSRCDAPDARHQNCRR